MIENVYKIIDYFNSSHDFIFIYYLLNLSWNNEEYRNIIRDNIIMSETLPVKLFKKSKYPFQLKFITLNEFFTFISKKIDFNHLKSLQILNLYESYNIYSFIESFEIFKNLQKLNLSSIYNLLFIIIMNRIKIYP